MYNSEITPLDLYTPKQVCNQGELFIFFALAITAISENAYLQTVDLALGSSNLHIYTRGNRMQNEYLNAILSSRSEL
jgi:hypothetical protein